MTVWSVMWRRDARHLIPLTPALQPQRTSPQTGLSTGYIRESFPTQDDGEAIRTHQSSCAALVLQTAHLKTVVFWFTASESELDCRVKLHRDTCVVVVVCFVKKKIPFCHGFSLSSESMIYSESSCIWRCPLGGFISLKLLICNRPQWSTGEDWAMSSLKTEIGSCCFCIFYLPKWQIS